MDSVPACANLQGPHQREADYASAYEPEALPVRRRRFLALALLPAVLSAAALAPSLRETHPTRSDRLALASGRALDLRAIDPAPPGIDGWEDRAGALPRFAAAASPARGVMELERRYFGRASARPFRLASIALLGLDAALFFALARRLNLARPWVAAALLAVGPWSAGIVVAGLAGQPTLVAAGLGLAATLLFLRASGVDRRTVTPPTRLRLPDSPAALRVGAAVLLAAAALSSPTVAAPIAALWLVVGFWRLRSRDAFRRIDRAIAGVLLAIGLGYGIALRLAIAGATPASLPADLLGRVALAPRLLWTALTSPFGAAASWHPLPGPSAVNLAALVALVAGLALAFVKGRASVRAAAAALAATLFASALLAPSALGETGTTDALLWALWAGGAIAIAAGVGAVADRWAARRAAGDGESDAEVEGLGEPRWRRPVAGLATLAVAAIACAPAFARSRQLGDERSAARRAFERSPGSLVLASEAIAAEADADRLYDAEQAALAAIDRHPTSAAPRVWLGEIYNRHDRLNDAIEAFRAANRIEPTNARAFSGLGDVLARRGKLNEAESAYRQAIALRSPGTLGLAADWNKLASLALNRSRFEVAKDAFERSAAIDPTGIDAILGLSLAEFGLANYEASAAHVKRALSIDPSNADALTAVGIMLVKLNDPKRAEPYFRAAAAAAPGSASALSNLGVGLAAMGRREEAALFLSRAIRADVESELVRKNFDIVKRLESK